MGLSQGSSACYELKAGRGWRHGAHRDGITQAYITCLPGQLSDMHTAAREGSVDTHVPGTGQFGLLRAEGWQRLAPWGAPRWENFTAVRHSTSTASRRSGGVAYTRHSTGWVISSLPPDKPQACSLTGPKVRSQRGSGSSSTAAAPP